MKKALPVNTDPKGVKDDGQHQARMKQCEETRQAIQRTDYITIGRRRMTKRYYERLRRAARKMVKDVRKYIKRKRL